MLVRRRVPGAAFLVAAAASLLLGAAPSQATALYVTDASPAVSPARGVSDGRLFGSDDPAVRAAGIRVAKAAGATYARLPIAWTLVARNETFVRPEESRLPLSDPAHPVYDWRRIDAALRDLRSAGLTPMVYFLAAPPWAMSAPRYVYAAPGTWAPRPADLAALASAVARRYDGTYPDPLHAEAPLPRVAHFQSWNEPNLARYLQPQWIGMRGRPSLFSARWYRRMHLAVYEAIHARQPDAMVGLAGLAPTGDADDGSARVSPLRFLRALLCLDGRAQRCGAPLPFDAIAIHPLSTGDPDRPAAHPDDLAVADLGPKVADLLTRARRAGSLTTADPPLWITELNWVSGEAGGVGAAQQAAVVGRAMMRLEQAGAAIVNWQFATDPPTSRTAGVERPAGLTVPIPSDVRRVPGAPKRFLGGFTRPAAAIAVGRDHAFVWALAEAGRPVPSTRASVQRRVGARWRTVASVPVSSAGVAQGLVRIPRGATLRLLIAGAPSPAVRVALRLGRLRPAAPRDPAAERNLVEVRELDDLRAAEADGPGAFLPLRPIVPGGTPPSLEFGPVLPVPAPARPARRLRILGSAGSNVLIGTSTADRLIGMGGDDLLIGLGGDDRFDAGTGRDVIVRGRMVERR